MGYQLDLMILESLRLEKTSMIRVLFSKLFFGVMRARMFSLFSNKTESKPSLGTAGAKIPWILTRPVYHQPHSIKTSKKHLALLHWTFSGLKVWRNRAARSMFSAFLPPGHQPFVFPLRERHGPGWRRRAAISPASAPSTALRGTNHPNWSPHGCGRPVWGRLTTGSIAQHQDGRRLLPQHSYHQHKAHPRPSQEPLTPQWHKHQLQRANRHFMPQTLSP